MKKLFDIGKSLANSNKKKGMKFEERIEKMFEGRLCFNIKRNVILKDKNGNTSEIDIVYGIFFKKYIECKCYDHSPVPLKDVAKFKEVLSLNNINIANGMFITSNYYVPRATTIGIQTIDGIELKKMEMRTPFIGILKFFLYSAGFIGFCGLSVFVLNHYKNNFEIGRNKNSFNGGG
ncbi:hypothetical protein RB653_000717 [Dictyostelium firmibasis]|uniref:Restriction endonuclease type IV Mrr domain-containing protein n=1 Tax=Dictyostelium firmibasis TaxID=79012 RepID=A0AAN7U6B0_9MYCE